MKGNQLQLLILFDFREQFGKAIINPFKTSIKLGRFLSKWIFDIELGIGIQAHGTFVAKHWKEEYFLLELRKQFL